ncbi:helix-turn-helix domain-containing protein [Nocardia sp. NBC_00565]|uniref:AraC family transcriptional regulator n=1 Tax=Nocardia sp. NBC_00565 TaxID=2975993 RepID=UPI002E7FF7AC|nr:helix-turn-helix domain-containing protein [Nocardia sp. NBC_00565]WUC08189.1 helix-turn-helix domain-containing protein [Nocardia sp. NBC_00565]
MPTTDLIESTVPAPESLRSWITELGCIPRVTDVSTPFTHVPHAGTTIVLPTDMDRRDALVLGPQTRASYAMAEKPAGCARLRLAPGATYQLLGVSAADLADRVVRLADLPGVAADLVNELAALPTEELLPFLEEVLPQRISEESTQRAHRELLRDAVAAIPTAPTIQGLAAGLAVSERQLRNLFSTGIGISPKHFARISRVRRVLTNAGNAPWSHLAATNGYFDQSHMTADFRTLMGVAPTSFLRGDLPAATPCQVPTRF